jgi:hypothetical protein
MLSRKLWSSSRGISTSCTCPKFWMSASIQDPFLLSSYGLPKHTSSSGNLHATLIEPAPSSKHVVVTSQGDGVHILDVSTLCSVSLHP